MATLSGNKIKNTYQSLVKFSDNGNITTSAKQLTDGFGNNSPMFVSTTQIGIGVTPEVGLNLHVYGDAKIGSNLTVIGNLVVEGSTTTVGTDTLTVKDPLIVLANNNTSTDAVDIGFYGKYHPSSTTLYSGLFREALTGKYRLFKDLQTEPTTTVNTSGTGYAKADLVIGNLEATQVDLGDDDKIRLGNSQDLEIFHGSAIDTSFIQINGNLDIRANTLSLKSYVGETMLRGSSNGAVRLYYDGVEKFITTSTGISITDDIIVSGTVDGRDIATDGIKLDTIEAGADVTDATNVLAAGAVMTTGNQSISGVKTFSDQVTIPATPSASTDAASKGYVDDNITAQNLDFSGDNGGTGSVDLDSQVFAINGTANQITTVQSGQSLTIAMPTNVTISGIVNATTFSGQLDGTISTSTTATTQSQGNNSTKVATTAYVDSAIGENNELSEVLANGNTTGGTDIAVSAGDDVTFTDTSKALFGASNDLQIYHDGSNSYINETGAGLLKILTNGLELKNPTDNGYMAFFGATGASELYFNTAKKFETTSTGISVTGNGVFSGNVSLADNKHLSIGTDSGDAFNTSSAIRIQDSADAHIQIKTSTTGQAGILIGDTDDDYVGGFIYSNDTNTLTFKQNNVDALSISGTQAATFAGFLTAKKLTSTDGVLELDDNGTHNGIINVPASLRINIDSDNQSTGEAFQVGHNSTNIDNNNILFKVEETGNATFAGEITASKNQNATSTFTFQNTDTTNTNSRTNLNVTAGNRFISLLAINDDHLYLNRTSTTNLYIQQGSATDVIIDSSGNVGIGTGANIYGDLHLQGGQQDIVLTNTAADGVAGLTISRIIGQARGYSNTSSVMQSIDFETNATNWYKGDIVFKTNNTDGTDSTVAATERMRIDSSGDVTIQTSGADDIKNFTINSSNGSSQVAGFVIQNDGANGYINFKAGAGNATPTTKLTIGNAANSGNVGIGTESPNQVGYGSDTTVLSVKASTSGGAAALELNGKGNADNNMVGTIQFLSYNESTPLAGIKGLRHTSDTSGKLTFETSAIERMRIDNYGYTKVRGRNTSSYQYSGNTFHSIEANESNEPTLVVYNATTSTAYGLNVINGTDHNNTTSRFFLGQGGSTERIKIFSNGNIANTNNSYTALSDIKLKENIEDATPKLNELMQVRIRNYNLKGEELKQIGVVAQELEEIFPALVYETPDTERQDINKTDEEGNIIYKTEEVLISEAVEGEEAVYETRETDEPVTENKEIDLGTTTKAVKYSVLVPIMIKAMQEQQQLINDLKNRIETLENK